MARAILAGLALVTWLTIITSFPFSRGPQGGADPAPARRVPPNHGGGSVGGGHPTLLALDSPGAESSEGQSPARPEFKAAGVCARCHVVSVLEWGISRHVAAGTSCQKCHGPSKGHVANERNEVKPDRLPRGAQIARMCMGCHEAGCPRTQQTVSCQNCHHVHALINPAKRPQAQDERLAAL